jgi:hypothetical protein
MAVEEALAQQDENFGSGGRLRVHFVFGKSLTVER